MFQMDLTNRAAAHLAKLKELGFDVIATDDFAEVERLVKQTGKPLRSPMFDLRRNDFTQGKAFWIFLTRDGLVVGGLAAKLIELGEESFEAYMHRVSGGQFGLERPLKDVAAPVNARLKGNLVYFGELYFADEGRGKLRVLKEFGRLSVILAAMTWPNFNWMYAMSRSEHRGMQQVFGFPMITHYALRWNDPKPYMHTDDQVLWYMQKVDLLHLLTIDETNEAAKH